MLQSVDRAIDVIETIARTPEAVPLKQLAASLQLNPATTHHLVATLLDRGWLDQAGPRAGYVLGPALRRLAIETGDRHWRATLESAVLALAAHFGPGVFVLAELRDNEIITTARVDAASPPLRLERPNSPLHPYGSASSLALQAYWPESRRAHFERLHPFPEAALHLWPDLDAYAAALAEVRVAGIAIRQWQDRAQTLLAVPVFGAGNVVRAAIGAAVPAGGDQQPLIAALRAAAAGPSEPNASSPAQARE